jgi:hypothetical protein
MAAIPCIKGCPCRKLKLEHIDAVVRPRPATNARALCGTHHAELARPSAAMGAFCPRCSIFGTMRERGEDGARQRTLVHARLDALELGTNFCYRGCVETNGL